MTDTFNSDWASCPGQTIKEYCEEKNQDDTSCNYYNLLYNHLGCSPVRFLSLLNGLEPITQKVADQLAEVFETSTPEFWLTLEQQFVEDLERIGVSRQQWVKENADVKLYKATIIHDTYFIAPASQDLFSDCNYEVEDLVRECLNDSTEFDNCIVSEVKSKSDLRPSWQDALPYQHEDTKDNQIFDVIHEYTCLQVLKANGIY